MSSLRYKSSNMFPLLSDFALTAVVPSVCCNKFHSAGKLKPEEYSRFFSNIHADKNLHGDVWSSQNFVMNRHS